MTGDAARAFGVGVFLALAALFGGALMWAVGSIVSRRARLKVNILVAAAWQMIAAGIFGLLAGSAHGEWPQFHVNPTSLGVLAYLIAGGSLIGYTAYIYLLEHVPVAKVSSYTYVNPVVAVLLGILMLHERPATAEFLGMAGIVVAVFLLTTAQIKAPARQAR